MARSSHEVERRRTHPLRRVLDAIFSVLRTGFPWVSGRSLSSNFPPWQTVCYHFRQFCRTRLWTHVWRELRTTERRRVGKDVHPSAAIMDGQSVKTVEESAHIRGFAAHKHVKGRMRHILVDTLGLPLSVYVTPADMHDTQGARRLLAGLKYFGLRLTTTWPDAVKRGSRMTWHSPPSRSWRGACWSERARRDSRRRG